MNPRNPIEMGKRDNYKFLNISDTQCALNQNVNLMGIIVEHGTPTHSKGTDWFISLRIVDESHHHRGFLVNVFAGTIGNLPKVQMSGDIIQLSHVTIKTFNAETYAIFNKSNSTFALYEGKYGNTIKPYQTSLKFWPRDTDKTYVEALRKWVDGVQLDTVSKDNVMMKDLKEGQFFDLVCEVILAIIHISEVDKNKWMLFVWDGSDVPPLPIQSKLSNELQNPIPLQVEPQVLPRNVLCKFPTVGTTLRVSVQLRDADLIVPSLITGMWVKLINMTSIVEGGLWCGVLTNKSKIRVIPNDDHYTLERQRDSENRLSSKYNRMPFTSFPWPSSIVEVGGDAEDVNLVTLMDILTHSQVTAKFKCVVRVVAALPSKVEDLRSPAGVYRCRVTLEDPTARIHAYIYAEDGETLFEGYPSDDILTRKWNALLGITEGNNNNDAGPRNPPWVACCIKSYYLDENDVWGSRRFRIFGTTIVC